MGYRSTVAYTIRFSKNKQEDEQDAVKGAFLMFLEEAMANKDIKPCFGEHEFVDQQYPNEGMRIDKEGCAINFFADGVKWYEDYPDVKCHEALVQMARDWLDEDNPCSKYLGFAYARVGEDIEDLVEDVGGNGEYDWVSILRQVVCDWI
jgi:hypothetical protein